MPDRGSKTGSHRHSFTRSTSSTSNAAISRTSTGNTSNSNPYSTSPTSSTSSSPSKTTQVHPHYCPAAYHPRSAATAIELSSFDNDDQYWENVRLNSHLSVDAWKTQSKVAQKAAARKASRDSIDNEPSNPPSSRGRAWSRSSTKETAEQERCKRPDSWKVRGMSWAVGVSGV